MENYTKWSRIYAELNREGSGRAGPNYTDEALSTFPRYNVLSAILTGVEKIDSDHLPDTPTLRNMLLNEGRSADSLFTKGSQGAIEARSIAEEREKFCKFISSFDSAISIAIKPLPYRRVLSAQETKSVWDNIFSRWKADGGYWYPLAERSDPSLFAFHTQAFDENVSPDRLRAIMQHRDIARVYELREYGDENYLLAIESWEPYYSGAEGFWVSDALDWILYASHEGSITTGGWLTEEILKLWPAGREQPWSFMKSSA